MVREVTKDNVEYEMGLIWKFLLNGFNYISFDTEFPGFLHSTPREASDEERYADVKKNVDAMKVIQLGITLSNYDGRPPSQDLCWQFTFRDFDVRYDVHSISSIELLRKSGIDFERSGTQGLDSFYVSNMLRIFLKWFGHKIKWITFHGLYDVAYLLKLLTGGRPLPPTLLQFADMVGEFLGCIYDTKYMARFCNNIPSVGEVGLVRLARFLKVDVDQTQHHQAGYDSLLTSIIFGRLRQIYGPWEEAGLGGFVYGMESARIVGSGEMVVAPYSPMPLPVVCGRSQFVRPFAPIVSGRVLRCFYPRLMQPFLHGR